MSNILEFRVTQNRERPDRPPVADDARGAEILIFTGVRYERASEPAQPSPDPRPAKSGPGKARRNSK